MNVRRFEQETSTMLWPVEALRGLAAFMVMWWHLRHWVSSERALDAFVYTGVDLFFVLSGFVFAPYVFGKPLRLRDFVVRRVLRIFPLFWVSLLLYVLLRHVQGADPWRYFWTHALMLHTSVSQEIAAYYNGAFWSLPVELEFYALLPLLAWCAQRQWWRFGVVLACALVGHFALSFWAVPGQVPLPWLLATVHWPGLWGEFLLGCLAWRLAHVPAVRRWSWGLLALAALVWLAGAAVWVAVGDAGVMAHGLLRGNMGYWAALAYALLLCVVGAQGLARVQPPAPEGAQRAWWVGLALLGGQLSYGVYLLHNAGQEVTGLWWPELTGWARVGAAAGVTVAAAWLLHHAVEAPARSLRRFFAG